MRLRAKWIWAKQRDYNTYNHTIIARKTFRAPKGLRRALLAVTADSWYRLYINDVWVNDGPCRGWPEHYYYDEIDVTGFLQPGVNEIRVVARYYGCGTFHQIPQQAGLLLQLDMTPRQGRKTTVLTDETWDVAEARAWTRNTPKITIQMGPAELYDARREKPLRFSKAAVLFDANRGPWRDLQRRDCPLLTRAPVSASRFMGAHVVRPDGWGMTYPVVRLLHPGVIEAHGHTSWASAIATEITVKEQRKIRIEAPLHAIHVNGKAGRKNEYPLNPGRNLLFAAMRDCFGFAVKDVSLWFQNAEGLKLTNPLDRGHENPWCFIPLEESRYTDDDVVFTYYHVPEREALKQSYARRVHRLLRRVTDAASFKEVLGDRARNLPADQMLLEDPHLLFLRRQVVDGASNCVWNPPHLMHDNGETTLVESSPDGDVELAYDLGVETCGYFEIDLVGEPGLIVDVSAVERIDERGMIQHTGFMRNTMRYVCAEGENRFMSTKRRAGRYLFLTLRNQRKPARIRLTRVVESTYPVAHQGSFTCSDQALERIWNMSARTLQLCMEDTFTDCPLYEQTLWVGDARNEALFAYTAFGDTELARRFIKLTGQSLEHLPIAGGQVPSSWRVLLPAWSFLWGIAVWEYYFYTGDIGFLREAWPWVMKNLRNAASMTDDRGLFSGPYWNLMDWTDNDDHHETVLHNSLFAVGAVQAALDCASALKDRKERAWLRDYKEKLVGAVNALWDDAKQAYPDSVHEDGAISKTISQHTSFLALLYDVVEPENRRAALDNVLTPPKGMVRVGSPFAIMFLYEALEKEGCQDEIVRSVLENYAPMIEAGTTTVWESFPSGTLRQGEAPTRSYCHAWSSAPLYFLNRIVLGIRQTAAGCMAFDISPRLCGLEWARGATATVHGPVSVSWKRVDDVLDVVSSAPDPVKLRFVKNDSHEGLTVRYNGRQR